MKFEVQFITRKFKKFGPKYEVVDGENKLSYTYISFSPVSFFLWGYLLYKNGRVIWIKSFNGDLNRYYHLNNGDTLILDVKLTFDGLDLISQTDIIFDFKRKTQ